MNCIYNKIREAIVRYFREKKGRTEVALKIVDAFTAVIDFVDEQILVSIELIQRVISEEVPNIWCLDLFIGSEGKPLLKFKYEGDEFVMHRVASNLYDSLEGMMEGCNNEIRSNSQIRHLV